MWPLGSRLKPFSGAPSTAEPGPATLAAKRHRLLTTSPCRATAGQAGCALSAAPSRKHWLLCNVAERAVSDRLLLRLPACSEKLRVTVTVDPATRELGVSWEQHCCWFIADFRIEPTASNGCASTEAAGLAIGATLVNGRSTPLAIARVSRAAATRGSLVGVQNVLI
jgi:hypothetical protein